MRNFYMQWGVLRELPARPVDDNTVVAHGPGWELRATITGGGAPRAFAGVIGVAARTHAGRCSAACATNTPTDGAPPCPSR